MNTIPNDLNPLGKEAEPAAPEQPDLPEGYTRLAFLRGDGNCAIDTGVNAADKSLGFWCKIQEGDAIQTDKFYCGAQYTRSFRILSTIGSDYRLGLEAGLFGQQIIILDIEKNDIAEVKFNYKNDGAVYCNGVDYGDDTKIRPNKEVTFGLFRMRKDGPWLTWGNPFVIYFFALTVGDATVRDYIPALDPQGKPCMYDKITKRANYNELTGVFTCGIETMDELFSLSDNLPAASEVDTNTAIALSLPGEFENDSEVQSYLIKIMAKGWTPNITYRS